MPGCHRFIKLFVIVLSLVAFTSIISPPPLIAGQEEQAPPKSLSLTISAPAAPLAPGDEALITLTAANTGAAMIEGVSLHLQSRSGIVWTDDFKGPWLELGNLAAGESRVIQGHARVEGLPADGSLPLFAALHGRDVAPVEAEADLVVPGRPSEQSNAPARGGAIETAEGRVRFVFPTNWNERDALVTFHLQEQYQQAAGETGRLLLFTVEAAAEGAVVSSFDRPVAIEVALADLVDPNWAAERPPVVSTRAKETDPWTAVESTFDPKTGLLQFKTTHFSAYQVTTEPKLWQLLYNPPGSSPYSGAATYQYPLSLPPGIGGPAPALTLAYSSRPAEGMRQPAMSQGFGAGWGLPAAQINNGNAGNFYTADGGGTGDNKNYDDAGFTLVLNGMNYYLNPLDTTGRYGTFKAIGSPDLYIEYFKDDNDTNNTDNVSGEFWRVKTADGTVYTFGQTADAEQVVWPMEVTPIIPGQPPGPPRNESQFRNPKFAPYNWKLNSVVDVHGNKIEYIYETTCGIKFDESGQRGQNRADGVFQCTEVDAAVKEIRYNFSGATAQTKVLFTNEKRNYAQTRQEKSMTAGVFRPTQIDIQQGAATLVGRYQFTYSTGAHYYGAWAVATEFWMLLSIQQFGVNGTTPLPMQTFAYNRDVTDGCVDGVCVKLLTEVANGYGAVTVLSYANWAGTRWQTVTQVETWDGVAHKKGVHAQGQT